MDFVRPEEETAAVRAAVSRPQFLDATTLTVSFRTDPDVVKRLLPPGWSRPRGRSHGPR